MNTPIKPEDLNKLDLNDIKQVDNLIGYINTNLNRDYQCEIWINSGVYNKKVVEKAKEEFSKYWIVSLREDNSDFREPMSYVFKFGLKG